MATERIPLFLEQEQYEAVRRLAQHQRRPVPDLVRDLVGLGLEQVESLKGRSRKSPKDALRDLSALRKSIEKQAGIYLGDPVEGSL
jgi:hypothetical protein